MKSAQLEKLEKLSGKRVDQTRQLLNAEVSNLKKLDSQCAQLTQVNKEYQRSLVGHGRIAPKHLEQRRSFVEHLSKRIEQAVNARNEKARLVQTINEEHVHRTAQHAAIEIVHRKKREEVELGKVRRDQQRMDEAAQQQFIKRQVLGSGQ